jgi:hypothetical protein
VSENEERDPPGGPRPAQDEPGAFDAFRAWRAQEQAGNEPSAGMYEPGYYGAGQYESAQYESGQYESEPTAMLPPGTGYTQPAPATPDGGRGRGRLRSAAVLAGAVVLVGGVVFGAYEATQPSSGASAAASPTVTASPTPSGGASKGAKNGRAVLARLTVTTVDTDSFTASTATGRSVSVQIEPTTRFGTAARPFTRSQLVPGAIVYARLRHEADGSIMATVIASATADKGSPSSAATPTPTATVTGDAGA